MKYIESFIDVTKCARKLPTSDYHETGKYPIIDQGQKQIAGYTNLKEDLFTDVPAIIFGDHTRVIKYIDTPFFIGADGVKVIKCLDKEADYKYNYYLLKSVRIPDTGYNRHYKWLKESVLPEHNKQQQQQIVKTLTAIDILSDKYLLQTQKLDELIKSRFVEMFGDPEINPRGWEKKNLSDVITMANNGMARRGNDQDGNIVLRLVELQDGYIDYSNPNRIVLSEAEKRRYLLTDNDFLFARVNGNPDNVGRCAVFYSIDEPVYHNDHIIRVHFDNNIINCVFASSLLNSEFGKRQLKNQIKTSAGQYTVSQDGIGAIVSILPPINLQNQFADFVTKVEQQKATVQKSIEKLETLKKSLMQEYFG